MKKRFVISTATFALATFVVSASAAYANPITFSGSTKSEYKVDNEHATEYKTQIKVVMDVKADEKTQLQLGLKYENKTKETGNAEKNKLEIENLWVENQLSKDLSLRLGSQSLAVGKGLWLDADGVTGGKLSYKINKTNDIELFTGRDSQDDADPALQLRYLNWLNTFDKGSIGAYAAKQDAYQFWGVNGEYKVAAKTFLSGEYVENTTNDTSGYVAELQFGTGKKVGECKTILTYLNGDANLFANEDYTSFDDQYNSSGGFKGMGASLSYKTSKAATLTAQKYWGEKKTDGSTWNTTEIKYAIKF